MKAKVKRIVLLSAGILAALLTVTLILVMLHSAVDYKIMDHSERLKAQLSEEYRGSESRLIERIDVLRPWYSLSPEKWTFVVTFSSDPETAAYRYQQIEGKYSFRQEN